MKYEIVIGIDPDVDKNGISVTDKKSNQTSLLSLPFPQTIDFVKNLCQKYNTQGISYIVAVEAGWLNHAHWHLTHYDTKQSAAAKGNATGRNHEVGRKIVEMLNFYQINNTLVKPLKKVWKSKSGKISHEELTRLTSLNCKQSNQEERDAALISILY